MAYGMVDFFETCFWLFCFILCSGAYEEVRWLWPDNQCQRRSIERQQSKFLEFITFKFNKTHSNHTINCNVLEEVIQKFWFFTRTNAFIFNLVNNKINCFYLVLKVLWIPRLSTTKALWNLHNSILFLIIRITNHSYVQSFCLTNLFKFSVRLKFRSIISK